MIKYIAYFCSITIICVSVRILLISEQYNRQENCHVEPLKETKNIENIIPQQVITENNEEIGVQLKEGESFYQFIPMDVNGAVILIERDSFDFCSTEAPANK